MNIFKREFVCGSCGQSVSKKQACCFEEPAAANDLRCKSQRLCASCATNRLLDRFLCATERAVVIYPNPNNNSYVFYSQDRMKQSCDTEDLINHIVSALPKESDVCNRCGSAALFTWCSADIMGGDVWNWQEPFPEAFEREYLCPDCLVRAFRKMVEENKIRLSFIHPYENKEGFATPWDC